MYLCYILKGFKFLKGKINEAKFLYYQCSRSLTPVNNSAIKLDCITKISKNDFHWEESHLYISIKKQTKKMFFYVYGKIKF